MKEQTLKGPLALVFPGHCEKVLVRLGAPRTMSNSMRDNLRTLILMSRSREKSHFVCGGWYELGDGVFYKKDRVPASDDR